MAAQTCGAVRGQLICDRLSQHGGPHRGYDDVVDEVLFWRDPVEIAAAATLARVALILRTFSASPLSLSSVQPVLDLAAELNPDLDLARVCGWCGRMMRAGRTPASHGMCKACQDRAFNER